MVIKFGRRLFRQRFFPLEQVECQIGEVMKEDFFKMLFFNTLDEVIAKELP
ncbi:hypothetical protein [Vibrio nitrifigilis]|uniref:Uncharacterized protein n=1 Tax=Vibrio nitrifigilis TaxID=2789781 RepID=A0ABS0GID8_9VIBR|nr:hypothetical protein [Vibrio nitrifigilis]MBF9002196.1 hypothetical protein [Vibrio nitrifigilis]